MLLLVELLLHVYLRVYDILRHHSRVIILIYYNPLPHQPRRKIYT